MDVFEPGPGAQIHDFNPSTFPPVGLFWTTEIPIAGVDRQVGKGRASLQASDVAILDYGTTPQAIFGGGPTPVPGTVSFKVVWSGVGEKVNIRNTDPVYGGFAGEFVRNSAQMEWSATVGDYTFVSEPLITSSSAFAEIGHERNGSFFPPA
ncbi:MAG TPA: hypothetical protein VI216_05925 [Candidatus Acidoferrales bacterium]